MKDCELSLLGRIKVSTVEEAVELASRFKAEGQYNWFRGQTMERSLNPTLARLGAAESLKAEERWRRFVVWISKTTGLKKLLKNQDSFTAIAQHYGMPTMFLDFTTEPGVAGFFAASKNSALGSEGCIYCLNTGELLKQWELLTAIIKKCPPIAVVTQKVPNLWRLEAQHGTFLDCPENWDRYYFVDRIVFPHAGLLSFPTRDQIIPSKKSQLEILLDHYFSVERYAGCRELFETYFPKARVFRLESPPNRYEANYFVDGRLPVVRGWGTKALAPWLAVRTEEFHSTALGELALQLDLRADPHSLKERVAYGVRRALKIDTALRQKSIQWAALPQKRLQHDLATALNWYWNGARLLPYSDEDLAEGVGVCFALHRLGYGKAERREEQRSIACSCFGLSLHVQASSWEGSYSDGFVSEAELMAAIRSDIRRRLLPKYRQHKSNVTFLLMLCSNPSRLFKFKDLARLFARQIVPTQVMSGLSSACYFSPARISGFGVP